jgi:hypothetical protein
MHQTVTQRKQVRLDETEMWLIATYCIENNCVTRYEGQKNYQFRVQQTTIAVEINQSKILGKTINANHVKTSMKWYMDMCMLFCKMPFQTPNDNAEKVEVLEMRINADSAAYDQLNERLASSIMQVDQLEKELAACQEACKKLSGANEVLVKCFNSVRNIMSIAIGDIGTMLDIK